MNKFERSIELSTYRKLPPGERISLYTLHGIREKPIEFRHNETTVFLSLLKNRDVMLTCKGLQLTLQELEVLAYQANYGMKDKEIAEFMKLTPRKVKKILAHARERNKIDKNGELVAPKTTELILQATTRGLLDTGFFIALKNSPFLVKETTHNN